ncbi:MAG: hypothetical protein JOS17DRAFT_807113 [Linnemannia elongata]|nr:MAG: hypothetical protein JOS17DRAFT_807113 [Linnemannia elongata]
MRSIFLSISLVGLFTSFGTWILPTLTSAAPLQSAFPRDYPHTATAAMDDIGIVYLPVNKSRTLDDMNTQMQGIIDQELEFTYDHTKYLLALRETICKQPSNSDMIYYYCVVEVLTSPVIELVPAKQVSRAIVCSTPTCVVVLCQSVTVGSTHSTEVGFSVQTGDKPFVAGLTLNKSFLGYGYSTSNQETMDLDHQLDLQYGETGFVALVNAQASTKVRIRACKCQMGIEYGTCMILCRVLPGKHAVDETAFHEAIILQSRTAKTLVSFMFL